jgi:hypothetical protein
MGIIEIILTIWAWNRGWRGWSLLPIGIGWAIVLAVGFVLYDAGVLKIVVPNIRGLIIIELAVLGMLIFMIARPREKPSAPTGNLVSPPSQIPSDSYGTPTVLCPVVKAKLIMPDRSEIPLAGMARQIGRSDFERIVSPEALRYISRQHLWIKYDSGRYFAEDSHSANGTKINGIEIKGKGLQELNDGDRIDIGEVIQLVFKMLS